MVTDTGETQPNEPTLDTAQLDPNDPANADPNDEPELVTPESNPEKNTEQPQSP